MTIYRKLAEAQPTVVSFQSRLAFCLDQAGISFRRVGRPAEAVTSFRQSAAILERLATLQLTDRYNLACVRAQLGGLAAVPGSGISVAEGQAETERAMQWLHRAVAAGYRNVALMQTDPDLDPLRSRPDFQLLMMDLAMPDDPFAPPD
jgi:hypothetical protein